MEFDKSKVYTSLNAEELKVGSEVILADNLESLKQQVEANSWPTRIKRLDWIMDTSFANRFKFSNLHYNLAYLVRKVEEEKPDEEENWIAYLVRSTDDDCHLTASPESLWEAAQRHFGAKTKLFVGSESEAVKWSRSRQKFVEEIKAWEDGEEIQVKAFTGLWYSASNPSWNVDAEYRVKPEEKKNKKLSEKAFKDWRACKNNTYVAYVDHYEPHLDFGSHAQWRKIQKYKGAKNKLFIGSLDECRAWCDSHDKFAEEILAWENGKEIQFRKQGTTSWIHLDKPKWCDDCEYRVKPDGLVWTDLKMGDILWKAGDEPAPLGGKNEYVYVEERRMVTGIVDDPGTKRHVQLEGDWIDDEDLKEWSVEE